MISIVNTLKSIKLILVTNTKTSKELSSSYEEMQLKSQNFAFDLKIKSEIAEKIFQEYQKSSDKRILGIPLKEVELSNSQKKINYLLNSKYYYRSILAGFRYNTKIIYPLEKSWRYVFEKNNIKINVFLSALLWNVLTLILIFKSLSASFKNILFMKPNKKSTHFQRNEVNLFFYDYPSPSDFEICEKNQDLNFQIWYYFNYIKLNQSMKDPDSSLSRSTKKLSNSIDAHKTKIENKDFFGSRKINLEIKISFEIIYAIIRGLFSLDFNSVIVIFENYYELLMYKRIVAYGNKLNISNAVFNASLAFHKPIWVFAIEKLGVDVDYFFYSVFSEPSLNEEQNSFRNGWQISRWSKIFAIDEKQKSDLLDVVKFDVKIDVMRSIPILNCVNNVDLLPSGPYMVCFDNNILYDHFHFGSLSSIGYDNLDLQIKFLSDILVTVINANLKLVYKIKRPGNLKLPSKYLSFLDEMKMKYKDNLTVIESDISPLLLMKSARATICKPLSTTALIANQNSLNVVFYDPSSLISKNDSNLRGIRTLSSVKELKQFVTEIGT